MVVSKRSSKKRLTQVGEDEITHVSHGQRRLRHWTAADKYRTVEWISRGQTVAAANQPRIQRNHIHDHAKAELLLNHFANDAQGWKPQFGIDEQFARVVAWLVMD